MKAIGFSLEDEDASYIDHEDSMRGVIAKFDPCCFFCNQVSHFKSDCPQLWEAVAEIKHSRNEEALSGVKARKARLISEAEARRKEKPQELATKKMHALLDRARGTQPETAAKYFKIDHKTAARDALNRIQQKLSTRESEQKIMHEPENERTQDQLNAFKASMVEKTKSPSSLSMKLNVFCGQTFGSFHKAAR